MTRIILLVAIASCVPQGTVYRPRTGSSSEQKDALYGRAVRAMSNAGLTIETNDATAGLVVSTWDCGSSSDCYIRTRFSIAVQDGRWDITVQCEERSTVMMEGAPYKACPEGHSYADSRKLDSLEAEMER